MKLNRKTFLSFLVTSFLFVNLVGCTKNEVEDDPKNDTPVIEDEVPNTDVEFEE